ncbi:hypothetical protein DFH07DRAFT_744208 [Mycena maculata]|uniref:Uncharacterized protein n=1 Tax=Mycena maculata TaxID=230809 RepID=A0AAD7J044_9AGAR|nr:hypothetical protein DFH07DRAFT_744208 [Mycena maculata]
MSTFQFVSENEKFGSPAPSAPSAAPHPAAATAGPPPTKYRKKFRWGEYIPAEQNPTLNACSTTAEVPISYLKIMKEQRELIDTMYHPVAGAAFSTPLIVDHIYSLDNPTQLQASAVMAQYSLDVGAREQLGNRWSQQWSHYSDGAKGDTPICKILYLCACRYDHHQRNTNSWKSAETHRAPFTSCLAHAELTMRGDRILRIRGHFNHHQGCQTANFGRVPPISVHPSVYVVALAQLRDGTTFSDIRQKNRDLFNPKAYKDFPEDLHSSPYRWVITHNDSRSLYHQYNRMKGVSVTDAPEINVDDWLDPKSDKFNATLAHAIFHYSPRAAKGERFDVAIANDEMNRTAWTYGHESQIILDGTFGVCDSRLLLFIVMTVGENRKGVPVAFLLFSAPTGNKQSSSGYDSHPYQTVEEVVGRPE